MILCIDVGNSAVNFGVFDKDKLVYNIHFLYSKDWEIKEWENTLDKTNLFSYTFEFALYSTVVPELDKTLKQFLISKNVVIKELDRSKIEFKEDIKKGEAIGDDIIADIVAGVAFYKSPMIIIDLGTATKLLVIDDKGYFKYAMIHPGLALCANSLISKASLLNSFEFKTCNTCLTNNTEDAINNAILLGHYEMINGLCERIENELGYKCNRIITGGATKYILNQLNNDYIFDENLNLKGLEIISRSY